MNDKPSKEERIFNLEQTVMTLSREIIKLQNIVDSKPAEKNQDFTDLTKKFGNAETAKKIWDFLKTVDNANRKG